jgi:hypothetical protein
MRFFLVFFIFFHCTHISNSQSGSFSLGARSAAMGNASVTIHDAYAMFNNIGGIAKEESITAALAFENRFGISSFNTIGAGVIIPKKWGNSTINIFKFGDELYSEHKLGLGYAHNLGMVSLGAQLNYIQYYIEGFGTRGALVIEFGGIAEIVPELIFGAHIFNVSQTKLSSQDQEHIATVIKSGLSYRPIHKLMINVEAEKDVEYKARYKAGIEYEIIEKFYIRSGFSTGNKHGYHGIGFWPGRLQIDYTLSNNFQLGFSHQASLTFSFLKNN